MNLAGPNLITLESTEADAGYFLEESDSDGSVRAKTPSPYDQGVVRNHHMLYLDTGDLVLKVEMARFKIHRHFLVKHSPVIASMFDIGGEKRAHEGTDEHPLHLDDKARAWELLLGGFYRDDPFDDLSNSGEEYILILQLAHKYCMETLEKSLISRLQKDSTEKKYINLLQASRIVDSPQLCDEAFRGLVTKRAFLTRYEAHIMGIDLLYDVMMQGTYSGGKRKAGYLN